MWRWKPTFAALFIWLVLCPRGIFAQNIDDGPPKIKRRVVAASSPVLTTEPEEPGSVDTLPRAARNAALMRGDYLEPLGVLPDREKNAVLTLSFSPHYGPPVSATLDIGGPVSSVSQISLQMTFADYSTVSVQGVRNAEDSMMHFKIPQSYVTRIFASDWVRFSSHVADEAYVMTFDVLAFHEGDFYWYAKEPLKELATRYPAWDAPLKIAPGASRAQVTAYLQAHGGLGGLHCWTVKDSHDWVSCGEYHLGRYQFYKDRLFVEEGQCEPSDDLGCTTLLNTIFKKFDSRRTLEDVKQAMAGWKQRKVYSLELNDQTFYYGTERGYVTWCEQFLRFSPPNSACMKER